MYLNDWETQVINLDHSSRLRYRHKYESDTCELRHQNNLIAHVVVQNRFPLQQMAQGNGNSDAKRFVAVRKKVGNEPCRSALKKQSVIYGRVLGTDKKSRGSIVVPKNIARRVIGVLI